MARVIQAGAASVPPGRARWAWLAGGMWFVAGQVLVYRCAYWLALCGAAALVTVLNWVGTSDDAAQVVMAGLLALAAGLGWAVPRRAWLSALVIGSVLAVTAMIEVALGVNGASVPKPGGMVGAANMFVLLIPAGTGAYVRAGAPGAAPGAMMPAKAQMLPTLFSGSREIAEPR